MPELATIKFVAGPFCGRELRIEAGPVESIGLVYEGETAVYRIDPADGDWYHVPTNRNTVPTGDAIYDEACKVFGEAELRQLIAITAVRGMIQGDKEFWSGFAKHMNRKASGEPS